MSQRQKVDKAALDKFEMLGGDDGKPHLLEFFLYFSTEWDAYVAATQLMNLRFKVNVEKMDSADKWLCLVSKEIKPTTERLLEVSHFMENVAESNNGFYDGWGTPMPGEDKSIKRNA
jgi:hypothetical protein